MARGLVSVIPLPVLNITIKEKGFVPRGMKRAYGRVSKAAWFETGVRFHGEHRDDRFTKEHGRKAGYKKRKGEDAGLTGKAFWQSYTGRKLRFKKHTRPLEWSGDTRRAVRSANITSTSKGAKVAYSGARKLNFRNPRSDINMSEEFRRLTPEEMVSLAKFYDDKLDAGLNADNHTETRSI